jgi:hypothetical protein
MFCLGLTMMLFLGRVDINRINEQYPYTYGGHDESIHYSLLLGMESHKSSLCAVGDDALWAISPTFYLYR